MFKFCIRQTKTVPKGLFHPQTKKKVPLKISIRYIFALKNRNKANKLHFRTVFKDTHGRHVQTELRKFKYDSRNINVRGV